MTNDILNRCKDELMMLSGAEYNNKEALNKVAEKVSQYYGLDDLHIDIIDIADKTQIRYKFKDTEDLYSSYTIQINDISQISIVDAILDHLDYIIKCKSGIDILNNEWYNHRVENGDQINIKYQFGNNEYCDIGYWDYTNIVIRLSRQSTNKIGYLYEQSEKSFRLKLNESMSKIGSIISIIDIINGFENVDIHSLIEAKLESSDLDVLLTKNMITPDTLYSILNSKDIKAQNIQNIYVVDSINQLGKFVVLMKWIIENKSIHINLIDDQVIDVENKSIDSSLSICSRIESIENTKACEILKEYIL